MEEWASTEQYIRVACQPGTVVVRGTLSGSHKPKSNRPVVVRDDEGIGGDPGNLRKRVAVMEKDEKKIVNGIATLLQVQERANMHH